jgi:hypothetical protein
MAAFSRGRPVGLLLTSAFCSGTRIVPPRASLPFILVSSQVRLLSRSPILRETSEQKAERMVQELKEKRMKHQNVISVRRKEQAQAAQIQQELSKRRITQAAATSIAAIPSEYTTAESAEAVKKLTVRDLFRSPKDLPMREYKPTILSPTPSLPSIRSLLTSDKEHIIYTQPRPGRSAFTATCVGITMLFGTFLIFLLAYVQTLIESGYMPNSVVSLAWTITGMFLIGMMYVGYSPRTGLVEKISLVARQVGSKPQLMARVEGRGKLPWSKISTEVPYQQVRVAKRWEDIEQPRVQTFSRSLSQMSWLMRTLAKLSLPFRSVWFQLRFRIGREMMIGLWTNEGRETMWNKWLLDTTGLVPKDHSKSWNDADGKLSLAPSIVHLRLM